MTKIKEGSASKILLFARHLAHHDVYNISIKRGHNTF